MHGTPDRDTRQAGPLLEIALKYASLGWRVLPIHKVNNGFCTCPRGKQCDRPGKHPRTRHGHVDATTDPAKVKLWKWESANIGIATGRESGLLVIDVDPRNGGTVALRDLQSKLGALPAGPMVKTGGDGWHFYFRHPESEVKKTIDAPGIDIKTDGGFVVAPPSVHNSGKAYQWEAQSDKLPLPDLPPAWLASFRAVPVTETTGVTETTEDVRGHQKTTDDTFVGSLASQATSFSEEDFIEQCISKTVPSRPGQRHAAVFKLARYLQGDPHIAARALRTLRPVVDRWFDRAVKAVGESGIKATVEENWWDFAEGWDKIKYPGEEGLMTALLERAKRNPLPDVAGQYQTPEIRLLIALCRELQRENGDQPFPLATSLVDRLFALGNNRMRAWRWLQGLTLDGVLEEVEKGNPEQRRASRYRYLGD